LGNFILAKNLFAFFVSLLRFKPSLYGLGFATILRISAAFSLLADFPLRFLSALLALPSPVFLGGARHVRTDISRLFVNLFSRKRPQSGGDWSRQLGAALGAEPLHYPTTPPAAGLFYFAHVLI
jgi:hypothetical protein